MNLLLADSILKFVGNKALLSDIFLQCEVGQIIGLLGSNGAGKTTLLNIIYGIEPADQRFVRVNGQVLFNAGHPAQHLVLLPQESHFPGHLRVRQLTRLYTPSDAHRELFEHELIKKFLNSPFGTLSTGEKRIVEIVLTLHHKAPFILMDEPFRGLSPVATELIVELIRSKSDHKGIIVTDHRHQILMELCNEVKLLREGSLKPVNNRDDLVKAGYLPSL